MQAARYKLGLLAGKKRFAHMPEQLDDETYGTISGAFGKDAQEACYVVRFVGRSQVEILGYVNMSGEVYRTCAPVKDAALPDVPDLVIRKSPDAESGSISVLDEHGRLRCISHFKGAVEGTMRENADEPTWNSKRSLRYGDSLRRFICATASLARRVPVPFPLEARMPNMSVLISRCGRLMSLSSCFAALRLPRFRTPSTHCCIASRAIKIPAVWSCMQSA